jgi:hypothetical protein
VIGTVGWLLVLGLLGIAHPILVRKPGVGPWWLVGAQALVGLGAALWGVWGLIETGTLLPHAAHFPFFWLSKLGASAVELGLPALFAWTIVASLFGRRGADGASAVARRLSIAQAVVGVLGVLVAIGVLVLDSGALAP